MEELTEEQELEKTNRLINDLLVFLVKANLDFNKETWRGGEGRDIILKGKNESLKEYKISFAFKNNGYVSIDVETKEEPEGIED